MSNPTVEDEIKDEINSIKKSEDVIKENEDSIKILQNQYNEELPILSKLEILKNQYDEELLKVNRLKSKITDLEETNKYIKKNITAIKVKNNLYDFNDLNAPYDNGDGLIAIDPIYINLGICKKDNGAYLAKYSEMFKHGTLVTFAFDGKGLVFRDDGSEILVIIEFSNKKYLCYLHNFLCNGNRQIGYWIDGHLPPIFDRNKILVSSFLPKFCFTSHSYPVEDLPNLVDKFRICDSRCGEGQSLYKNTIQRYTKYINKLITEGLDATKYFVATGNLDSGPHNGSFLAIDKLYCLVEYEDGLAIDYISIDIKSKSHETYRKRELSIYCKF